MSALKKAVPFLILGGVAAMVGGGVFAYNRAEAKQKEARDQAFTDLSQCLMGDIIASGDDTLNRIGKIQNRVAHRTNEGDAEGGREWPGRCATITRDMSESVRTSSFLDEGAKRDLLKELERLQKELELPNAAAADLGLPILALWRVAEKHKISVTRSSSVAGPPVIPVMPDLEKALLPFGGVQPIANGPAWAFYADGRGDNKHYVCSLAGDALECTGFEREGSFYAIGTWSSPARIPFWDGAGSLLLLNGNKLEPVETKFSGVDPRVHLSESGTLYALGTAFVGEEVKQLLVVRTAEGKTKTVGLEKALEKASEGAGADAVTATLLANNVLIRRTAEDGIHGDLQLFTIGDDAKLTDAGKMPAKGSVDMVPAICRIASGYALDLSVRQTTLMFWDNGKWAGPVNSDARGLACAPSGVWVAERQVCNGSGCTDVLAAKDVDKLLQTTGALPSSTKFGDKSVLAWHAREGSGVMVRVATIGSKDTPTETVVSETSSKGGSPNVYGDTNGAIVFDEGDGKLIGVRVKADGSVIPLAVTLK